MFLSHKGVVKAVCLLSSQRTFNAGGAIHFCLLLKSKGESFKDKNHSVATILLTFNKGWGSNSHIYLRHFSAMFLYLSAHKNTRKLIWTENIWMQSIFLFLFFFCIGFWGQESDGKRHSTWTATMVITVVVKEPPLKQPACYQLFGRGYHLVKGHELKQWKDTWCNAWAGKEVWVFLTCSSTKSTSVDMLCYRMSSGYCPPWRTKEKWR